MEQEIKFLVYNEYVGTAAFMSGEIAIGLFDKLEEGHSILYRVEENGTCIKLKEKNKGE